MSIAPATLAIARLARATLIALALVAGPLTNAAGAAQPAQAPSDASIAAAVDSLALEVVRRGLTPGLGVSVVRRGRIIHARGYGLADVTRRIPADEATLWYIASTSKSFTGFAASLLADRGVLDFTAPIATQVPRARWHAQVRPESLTLAHFLSHTHRLQQTPVVVNAAFSGALPESRWPELLEHCAPTGSADLQYSNLGYNVAAMAIDHVRAEGWRRYLEEQVLAPVGMRETYARVSGLDPRRIAMPHALRPDGTFETQAFQKADATMNSAGGHLATVRDLARWVVVQMDSGVIDGRRVFPASAIVRSQTVLARHTREQARSFAFFAREGWGAGWDIGHYEGERMVSRFGSYHSTRSHLSFLPGQRVGVVAQVNGETGSLATDIVAAFAYDLHAGRPDARRRAAERLDRLSQGLTTTRARVATDDSSRRARQAQPLPRPASEYAGRYRHPFLGEFEIVARGESLTYRWGVLAGTLENLDPSRSQLRLQFAGNVTPLTVDFAPGAPARGVTFQGSTFTRVSGSS